MQTTISTRHCDISDSLRERVTQVIERIESIAPRSQEATVIFDVEGLEQTAEIRLHVSSGELMVARGDAADHRTALDRAEDKLRRQLEKAFGRPRHSKPHAPQM